MSTVLGYAWANLQQFIAHPHSERMLLTYWWAKHVENAYILQGKSNAIKEPETKEPRGQFTQKWSKSEQGFSEWKKRGKKWGTVPILILKNTSNGNELKINPVSCLTRACAVENSEEPGESCRKSAPLNIALVAISICIFFLNKKWVLQTNFIPRCNSLRAVPAWNYISMWFDSELEI